MSRHSLPHWFSSSHNDVAGLLPIPSQDSEPKLTKIGEHTSELQSLS